MSMDLLVFALGAAFGAAASVTAERLWRWFESRTRIEIHPSVFQNIRTEQGVRLRIKNVGWAPLAPYQVVIKHRGLGSVLHEEKDLLHELAPEQLNEHDIVLVLNGQPTEMVNLWYAEPEIEPHSIHDDRGYTFQLVLDKSDHILYSNAIIGNALASITREVQAAGRLQFDYRHLEKLSVKHHPRNTEWVRRVRKYLLRSTGVEKLKSKRNPSDNSHEI